LKTRACLATLDEEAQALGAAPLSIGQVTIGCALGYLDYRFGPFGWREQAPRLASWYATLSQRPSFKTTEAIDG
jgi:glutathione S-transferase